MFDLNIIETYFFINILYTLHMFFFFHNHLAKKIIKNTNQELTPDEIIFALHILYIMYVFFGIIPLFLNILLVLVSPKDCLWLKWAYKDKGDK